MVFLRFYWSANGQGAGREGREAWGDEARRASEPAPTFAICAERLEGAIGGSCDSGRPWPDRVAAAIQAALGFADADPVAARAITIHTAYRRVDADAGFPALIDRLAARLNRDAPPTRRPDSVARNIVLRVARQTLLQLELRPDSPATEIAPDLIVFALTPYVGLAEAKRWAAAA